MMPDQKIRQSRSSALKQRVMDAALIRFSEVGVERTNVGDILKDADCSVGSLYHHFGNKEGIAEALFIHGIATFNRDLLDTLLSRRTAQTGVKAIVTHLCRWATEQSSLAAFLLSREIKLSEEARLELREMDQTFNEALVTWFRPHIDNGNLRKLPAELYVPLISGPTLDYARMWLSGRGKRSPHLVADALAQSAWDSVKA